MDNFPTLRTGAVIQYPASRVTQFSSDIVQFLDGTEQRFCIFPKPYRAWIVKLANLDETELQSIRNFIQDMNGAVGIFTFTDPWDGTTYPNCSLQGTEWTDSIAGPVQCTTSLTVRELPA